MQSQPIMASNLVELVNEYYEARKPYSQRVREAHASLPTETHSTENHTSIAESSDKIQSQQEPSFSMTPRIPNDEIEAVLKKLEAAKLEYGRGETSTGKGSEEKK